MHQDLARLRAKAKAHAQGQAGPLSLAEQIELDRHEKDLARIQEQAVLAAGEKKNEELIGTETTVLPSNSGKTNSLPPISFPEHSPEARAEREKRAPARKFILEQDGIKPDDKTRVQSLEKGQRPEPKTYMPESFIQAHREEFVDGASRIISTDQLNKWGPAQRDGTAFVFSRRDFDAMLLQAGGDRRKLEDLLGLPSGAFGDGDLSRVDIDNPSSYNIRVPSGNEAGANPLWLPGARLPQGHLEAVIDLGKAPPEAWKSEALNF